MANVDLARRGRGPRRRRPPWRRCRRRPGSPSRSRRMWRSGTFSSGMLTDERAMPLAKSTTLGTPMPTASAGSCSSIASASWSTSASGERLLGRAAAAPRPAARPPGRRPPPSFRRRPRRSAGATRAASHNGLGSASWTRPTSSSRLRARDEQAFAELVREWSPSMLRLARTYVTDRAAAEEVVQEAWLGVLQGIDRFEGRSQLKTWVYRILVNRAMTKGRPRGAARTPVGGCPAVDPARFTRRRRLGVAAAALAGPARGRAALGRDARRGPRGDRRSCRRCSAW